MSLEGVRSRPGVPAIGDLVVAFVSCMAVASPANAWAARQSAADAALAGRVFTVAGALRWRGPADPPRLATRAELQDPQVGVMPDGAFLLTDTFNDRVLRVWPSGRISRVAGTDDGIDDFSGDGGPATSATLAEPYGVAALRHGGFLLADTANERVRRVWPDGHISTVAGNGSIDFSGDGGPATSAALSEPEGVAALRRGGFLIADTLNNRIRRVWPDGHISTVAGNGRDRFSGDGGPATRASLSFPEGVAALPDGGFLVGDTDNYRVRRVWPNGRISTAAGNGKENASGDGGPATSAAIGVVDSVAAVSGGGFLIGADTSLSLDDRAGPVRRVRPDGRISSIFAGDRGAPYGDGGPASSAQLYGPPDATGTSVAAMPGGGALIGYGTSVRLVVGRHGTRLLAAAIRALASVASAREYRARVVLTRPARVTIRVYDSLHGRPVATASHFESAGESTVTLRPNARFTSGLYGMVLSAHHGSQTTRAEQYAYLGGTLTRSSIHSIQDRADEAELATDPNGYIIVRKCHQFSSLRVDCFIEGDETYVEAWSLTPQGQLRARTYNRRRRSLFRRNPPWNGPAIWADLGAAWNPAPAFFPEPD